MKLNAAGELAEASWTRIPEHFAHVTLDEFVVMPNHVHGVLILEGEETSSTTRRRRLGTIIGSFKSAAAKAINERRGTSGSTVWHRSFYDHIIRNEDSLGRIRRYIQDNPARWQFDVENPMRVADPSGREDEDW